MYGKNLLSHTSPVLRPIEALLLLLFQAFEGLHDNIKFDVHSRSYSREMTGKVNANRRA